ncbi:MAG: LysE family transporter [Alphaproteobacteria bacterium]|nr:LysE family transporter [Alphaproteobacteria bacterium]
MTSDAIITLSLAVFALALKPGPGMMMVMSRTISGGMGACFTFMLGFLLVTMVYLWIVLLGFHLIGLDMVFLAILVKAAAAVYLIHMGAKGIIYPEVSYGVDEPKGHSFFDNLSAAIMLTAANPIVIVFYAGILPTVIDIHSMSLKDMFIVSFIVLGIEGGMPLIYCAPFALFKKKLPTDFLKGLRIFSSIIIILIGLYIGYSALPSKDLTFVF